MRIHFADRAGLIGLALLALSGCGRMSYEAHPDLLAVDLASPADLESPPPDAAVDLATAADLAVPDLAQPDASVDLAIVADLAAPDLAAPDLATPDLVILDLVPPPDLTAPRCDDKARNGTETDVDCGGSCSPCLPGKVCATAKDCASGVCAAGRCSAPTCSDGVKNGSETDSDCGGGTCPACADGKGCGVAGDCASGVCSAGRCAAPTCSDGVKNGGETDVDCAGGCDKCADLKLCKADGDCRSGQCLTHCSATLPVTTYPTRLAIGDVTGDGKLDVAVAHDMEAPAQVGVLVGQGGGRFAAETLLACTSRGGTGVAIADLDGNGTLDIAASLYGPSYSPGVINLFFSLGGGAFSPARAVSPGDSNTMFVAPWDLDGDSRIDLAAVHNNGCWGLSLLHQDAGGNFAVKQQVCGGSNTMQNPQEIAIADLNRDGNPDLVVGTVYTGIKVFLGKGGGQVNGWVSYLHSGAYNNPYNCRNGPSVGDLDGDGDVDIIAPCCGGTSLVPLLNRGDGTFTVGQEAVTGSTPHASRVADLDGDGKLDVVTTNGASHDLSFLAGKGDGTFAAALTIKVGKSPRNTQAADLDGDGKLDLVTSNSADNTLTVMLAPLRP